MVPPRISNVYCAASKNNTSKHFHPSTPQKKTESNLTNRHKRKERPEPINRQKDKIDPHDAAPSLEKFKRYGQVADDQQRRGDHADERHGPGYAAVVRGADDEREEEFEAAEEDGHGGGQEDRGPDAPVSVF